MSTRSVSARPWSSRSRTAVFLPPTPAFSTVHLDGDRAVVRIATEVDDFAPGDDPLELAYELRDPDGALMPTAGVADLDGVVRRTREAGVAASLVVAADLPSLPRATEVTVHRIVQEGLTNVVRHAPGAWAQVRVGIDGGDLLVEVEDGGARVAPPGSDHDRNGDGGKDRNGFGLAGLRERVQLVGGTLQAGPLPAGAGWRLAARLPLASQEAGT